MSDFVKKKKKNYTFIFNFAMCVYYEGINEDFIFAIKARFEITTALAREIRKFAINKSVIIAIGRILLLYKAFGY